jgi:hypothetical protein
MRNISIETSITQWNDFMALWEFHNKWVLDNLEHFEEFRVPWNNYGRLRKQCPNCLTYQNKTNSKCKLCGYNIENECIQTFGVGKAPNNQQEYIKTHSKSQYL